MARIHLPKFNPELPYVVIKQIRMNGEDIAPGTPVTREWFTTRRLRQLYELRRVGVAPGYFETPQVGLEPHQPVVPPTYPGDYYSKIRGKFYVFKNKREIAGPITEAQARSMTGNNRRD